MSSEFGESTKVADEDDLTALEKFANQFYNGVCGVLCVFTFIISLSIFVRIAFSLALLLKAEYICTLFLRFVMSKETAGSSVTVMGGMIVDFLQSAIRLSNCSPSARQ